MGLRMGVVCLALLVSTASVSAAQRVDAGALGDVQTTQSGELVLRGALQGDVHGTMRTTLRLDSPSHVTGDWALTLVTQHADGSTSPAGVLMGRVHSGTVLTDSTGVVALQDVKLVITEGLGDYAGLAAGDGTLDVQLGFADEPFQASLSLTF
jgi:hypothetical protein